MRLTVIGTGYLGAVHAACMAEIGHDVLGVDVDIAKIEALAAGRPPFHEAGLGEVLSRNVEAGRLRFTTSLAEAGEFGDVHFVCVGTPQKPGSNAADMKYIDAVIDGLAPHLHRDTLVVGKSTVPVGTCEKVKAKIAETLKARGRQDLAFDVASNPEFLKEGSAVADCMKPDRIIVGTNSEDTEAVMRELYAPFNRNHEKMIVMDVRSAEFTKYAANCMLATKISFMNEMANLAEQLGADIEEVRKGIGSDPRIGYHFIYPGLGYGGSCFPKDVRALIKTAEGVKFDAKLLRAVEERNNAQKSVLFDKVHRYFKGSLKGKTFALWGLAFKPNTDDVREASSLVLIRDLIDAGARVRVYDPQAMQTARTSLRELQRRIQYCDSASDACEHADALVVVTEWLEFRSPDFAWLAQTLRARVLVDGRNLYAPGQVRAAGLKYYGIGRAQT